MSTNSAGCFNCGKLGQIKDECPWVKKEKAFQATWDGSENDEKESENKDLKAYMATTAELEISQELQQKPEVSKSDYSFDPDTKCDELSQEVLLNTI
ncbi:hypothetical protein LINPERPRIM_LOCUS37023 [Linum perenne]